ncbi:MAG: hypothetical protein KC636_35250 [Myxococcales bacterium]|nr:hypothetical protein [Myxococcales bacterium]
MRAPWLLPLVIAVLALLATGATARALAPASDAPPAGVNLFQETERKCAPAWTLSALGLDDRRLVYELCRDFTFADLGRAKGVHVKPTARAEAEVASLLRRSTRLMEDQPWQVGELARLLPPALYRVARDDRSGEREAAPDDARVAKPRQTAARPTAKREDLAQCLGLTTSKKSKRKVDEAPLAEALAAVDRATLSNCLPEGHSLRARMVQVADDDDPRAGGDDPRVLVLLVGELHDDALYVIEGGARPEIDGTALPGAGWIAIDVPERGARVFVGTVRMRAPVMFSLDRKGLDIPVSWFEGPLSSTTILKIDDQAVLSCLNLQVAVDPGAQIFIDGRQVHNGPVVVSRPQRARSEHRMTVMHRDANASAWVINAEETIEVTRKYTSTLGCEPVSLDLRSSRAVALTSVRVNEACAATGVDGAAVWGGAARFLQENGSRAGLAFRDFDGVAQVVKHLQEIERALGALGGDPVGASRGSRDTRTSISTAARELWRQGIGRVISLELQCREGAAGEQTISLLGRSVDIDLIHEEAKDPLVGVDLGRLVTIETEDLNGNEGVAPATRRLVSRLLQLRYIRFASAPRTVLYTEPMTLVVELYDPGGADHDADTITIEAFGASEATADAICDPLMETGRVAGRVPEDAALGRRRDIVRVKSASAGQSTARARAYAVELRPRAPETLIIRGVLGAAKRPKHVIYHCVTIENTYRRLWLQLSIGGMVPIGTAPRLAMGRIETGLLLTSSRTGHGMHLGPVLGFQAMNYQRSAPPSWDDLATGASGEAVYTDGGAAPIGWNRFSVLLGARVNGHFSWCVVRRSCGHWGRRFKFFVSGGLTANVGFIDARDVPTALTTFLDAPRVDVDLDLDVAVSLLNLFVSNRHGFGIVFDAHLFAFDDGLWDFVQAALKQPARPSARINHDFGFAATAGIRYTWDLR